MTQALHRIQCDDAKRLSSVLPDAGRVLDTMFDKALESRPEDRYATADELGADLRRYLDRQPIAARPPSRRDWIAKFVRRNPVLVGGVAATMLALLLGISKRSVDTDWSLARAWLRMELEPA